MADDKTTVRRRQIAERMGVLAQLVRTKERIQAILHANLIPKYDGHLFGPEGRKWLTHLPLTVEERALLGRYVNELERVSAQLAELDKALAQQSLDDPRALRLMTIPGVSSVVALAILASIGDIHRFPTPEKLSSYFGLTPRIRQSGDHPARHGRITKQGNSDARRMLVEAAWSAKLARDRCAPSSRASRRARCAGRRRGNRKKADGDDLAHSFEQPGLRLCEAGVYRHEAEEGGTEGWRAKGVRKAGPGHDYWIREIRDRETRYVERAERAYEQMVLAWKEKPLRPGRG